MFFVTRDLGFVHKIYRGLAGARRTREALGRGGRDVRDRRRLPAAARRRPRDRGARLPLYLPARKEGIIRERPTCGCRASSATGWRGRRSCPGASSRPARRRRADLRRGRRARRDGRRGRARASTLLTSSGLVNAAANRRALRVARSRSTSSASTWPPSRASRRTATSARRSSRNLEEHWRGASATSDVERAPRERRASCALSSSGCGRRRGRRLGHRRRLRDAGVRAAEDVRARRSPRACRSPQGRPARALPVRPVRGAARAGRAHPRVERHARQADRRRLHASATSTCGPR